MKTLNFLFITFSLVLNIYFKDAASKPYVISQCENKKHIDASIKEQPQTLLIRSEEICKPVLCNKHILHHILFQTDNF